MYFNLKQNVEKLESVAAVSVIPKSFYEQFFVDIALTKADVILIHFSCRRIELLGKEILNVDLRSKGLLLNSYHVQKSTLFFLEGQHYNKVSICVLDK